MAQLVTGLKRLAAAEDKPYAEMTMTCWVNWTLLRDPQGYWKGGTVGVLGYGAGVIPRFSELTGEFPGFRRFHTLRIMPPAGMHYDTDMLREFCDIWEKHGSGLIALHGQSATSCSRVFAPIMSARL